MLNGPYGTRIFLPQIAQIDTEEKHRQCSHNKNPNYFKEHETRRRHSNRREKSVEIRVICGSKNKALNALEKTSGRKRPRIADRHRCVIPVPHGSDE